jgi:hypothetical protein
MENPGFRPYAEIERFLNFAPLQVKEIALELRNLVAAACPQATERIRWGGLSYHDPAKGGPVKGAICQIEIEKDHVRLGFIHGAWLEDPHALLRGRRLSKRYVVVNSYEETPWEAISALIQEAAELDPATFGPIDSVNE